MPANYKFHYFPVRGRGDLIRYIFEYAGVQYEEITISPDLEEWNAKTKKTYPMGVLPLLELSDGRKLSQSLAIARYLATVHGLVSSDPFENAWGDQLVGALEDTYAKYFWPYAYATLVLKDVDKQKEAWNDMKTNCLTSLFGKLEEFLGDKQWFCGNKLHWSDLVIAEYVDRIESIYEKGFTQPKFPHLYAHCKRVHELPAIKKYVEKRPAYPL